MHELLSGAGTKLELGVFGSGLGIVKWLATGGFSLIFVGRYIRMIISQVFLC